MQISKIRDDFDRALLRFLWDQWTQLGVSGTTTVHSGWAADPEALLGLTMRVARADPRLFDEVLDWLAVNLRLVSLQRLRNITRGFSETSRIADAAWAWATTQSKVTRTAPASEPRSAEANALFFVNGKGLGARSPDSIFLAFGWKRESVRRSFKSREPSLDLPINFGFKLREVFGIGTRSEVLRFLITSRVSGAGTRKIAEETAFSTINVRQALDSLERSGAVKTRGGGRQTVYRVHPPQWAHFLDTPEEKLPSHVAWVPFFRAVHALHSWLEIESQIERTDYMRASESRVFVEQIRDDLASVDIEPSKEAAVAEDYSRIFTQLVKEVSGLLATDSTA